MRVFRIAFLAATCVVCVPLLANAQEKQDPAMADSATNSQGQTWHSLPGDPGFVGAILGALLGGAGSAIAVWLTTRATRKDSRRHIVRELHKEFVYGSMLRARLRAELLLFYDVEGKYKGKNFEELYKGGLSLDEYADVAAVLNLFRLLNDYKIARHIDEEEARSAFGWMYCWWWKHVIVPHSVGLEDKADWVPHITRRDWLLKDQTC